MSTNEESKNALKATGTVGGGQVINIVIGLVRVKFAALILGPAGVGIVGILTTAFDMIRTSSGLGLTFSGVRDISQADARNDDDAVARTVKVFNYWVFLTALLGMLITIVCCVPISRLLFKHDGYALSIAIASISVFLSAVAAGFTAVMQGKRAVGIMVKSGIIGNLISTILVVIVYQLLGEDGIVPGFIIISLVNVVTAWFFYKKLEIPRFGELSFGESWGIAKGMITIGAFTIFVSVFDQLMSLGLRAFISQKSGIEGVGLLTAATTIAGFYLNVVLTSIGTDYYPKVAAIHDDNEALNRSVNSQLYIILLLASPLIIGMVGFGDVVINLLYSSKFEAAVPILKWQILGDFFKIISWPCSYIFLAKGLGKLYVGYSVTYTILNMAIIYFGWPYMGFLGIGISFFIAQFCAVTFTYIYSYYKFKISIGKSNVRLIILGAVTLIAAYLSHEYLEGLIRTMTSALLVGAAGAYAVYRLDSIINVRAVLNKLRKR
jgi:O-antigen/teichoic acid export membrane protein